MLKNPLPISLYVLLPLLFHAPIWLGVVDFYTGEASDLILHVYGSKSLIFNSIQESGELPLWNPYIMFGQPSVGNIQYALFYPPGLLFAFLPFFRAIWVGQVVHMAIAGYGTYRLAKYYGCAQNGSLIAGLLYMFNGKILFYINAGWVSYFYAISWVPLLILSSQKVLAEDSLKGPVFFGVIFALCLLCGTPQFAFMGFYLLLLQGLWICLTPGTGKVKPAMLFRIVLAGIVSFLLIAVQLFPSVEMAYLSSWQFFNPEMSGFHLDLSFQQWFQVLVRPEVIPRDFNWELCIYIGIGGLIFAALGLLRMRRYQFLCVWGLLPLLLSLGEALPWLDGFVRLLPGIGMLTNSSRYLIITVVVLCVAAGFGLEQFLAARQSEKEKFAPLIIAGAILIAGIIIPPVGEGDPNTLFAITMVIFISLISLCLFWKKKRYLWHWLLLCWLVINPLLIAPYILNGYRIQDIEPPGGILNPIENYPGPVRVALIQPDHLRDNLISPLEDWVFIKKQIGRAGGYDPLTLLRTLNFLGKMDGTDETIKDTLWGFRLFGFSRPRLYNLAGITHLITTTPLSDPQLNFVAADKFTAPDFHGGWWRKQDMYLYENTSVLPRAIFMPDNFRGDVMPVDLKMDTVNRRQLELESTVPGTVVLSESFHPGWIAMEKAVPLAVTPFIDTFISFKVPAGRHQVNLEFLPKSYTIGSWLSVLGIILVIVLYGYARYCERGRRLKTRGPSIQ